MIRYYVLDDSGEAVEATYEEYRQWLRTSPVDALVLRNVSACGCGVAMIGFTGVGNDEKGTQPFVVEFRIKAGANFNLWYTAGNVAYFRHRKDAIAHAQRITEKVGAAWNGILDIIQQELPSKA